MKENQKRKYEVKKILKFIDKLDEILGGEGVIDYIAATPEEFSVYINQEISMLLIEEIDKFKNVFIPDSVFFNRNYPQLIIANTKLSINPPEDKDIKYENNHSRSS